MGSISSCRNSYQRNNCCSRYAWAWRESTCTRVAVRRSTCVPGQDMVVGVTLTDESGFRAGVNLSG
eukprot:2734054-Rhodomonas_salina.1